MSITRILCYGGCGVPICYCRCEKDKGDELLKCPFCGGKAGVEGNTYNSVRPDDWSVGCDGEHCKVTPYTTGSTRVKAVDQWNNRYNVELTCEAKTW